MAASTGALAAAVSAVLAVTVLLASPVAAEEGCTRRPVVFAFGDSNTDTGGTAAALGSYLPLPEGRTHFRRSTGRLCDGRLVIDYLSESLNMSYLSPYMEALGSDFSNGANFAIAGSGTLPRDRPFALHVQVQQFVHFKQRSLQLISQGEKAPVDAEGFRNALYLIDIGQNDLSAAFSSGLTYDHVVHHRIPDMLSEIQDAIVTLFYDGAKNFWVHGTGPLGCLPQKLAEAMNYDDGDLDDSGCLRTLNNASHEFNDQLCSVCHKLTSQLKGATIVYTDILSIKYDLVANHSGYAFEEPLMACCGYGGPPYNYNVNVSCLDPGYRVCEDGGKFVSWDGVHYTDAANAVVAAKILSAEFSTPNVPFGYFCKT
ncbi:unnamed protein product [Triticum turgidum subsp. durum]|uniref:GDSL esterase/lipase LIP-4 n=1 Tax=Triticum turgidum subsp. durum TaxID=4567 RepID=A0A9R1PX44_TRITD|nr:unnamed protein product [Triticum turgidum subsp. durum]